jgi:hypothetical protein
LTTCAVEPDDVRACIGKCERHALSQSLPRASDEGNLSIEFE